jgi:MIP family channel proteins
MYDLWKSLVAEFIGTFILVLVGGGAVALSTAEGGSVIGNAFAFGLIYLALIYMIGNYSGAHYNPIITFGAACAGRFGWCRMLLYWIAQIVGAIAAGALIAWIFGHGAANHQAGSPGGPLAYSDPWKVVVLEMFLTFFLVLAFLFMTRNPMVSLISGLVIGLTLTADFLVGGYLARVGVNPAYALGTQIFGGNLSIYWIYILGPFLGALLAAIIYKALTFPWTCQDVIENGCKGEICGYPTFYEEWKECDPEFMRRGKMMWEANKAELEAKGDFCTSPCDVQKCEVECKPKCEIPRCETKCDMPMRGRKPYRFVPL